MKSLRITAVLASLLAFAWSAVAQVTDYRQIQTPPLRKFSMPEPKRIELPNGMVIFLQEDHELPLIKGTATIRGGSRDVPAAKAGLVGIYSQAWRTGGTAQRTGDELDEFLESRAAKVETGGDADSTTVSLDTLKGDFDVVFPIWLDLLRNPQFRQEKIDLAKTQANTAISRRNDEPSGILAREIIRLGYGPDSPYSRQSEYATIASITRDDLLAFHRRTVHPNNIIVSFIGDFDSAKLEKRLRDTFASWPRGPKVEIPDPAATPAAPGIYFIPKEDVTQSNIAMVHPGIQRNNPDYHAVVVMNEIFSGGFSGRLMQTLRSQRGLTYGAGGGFGAPWDHPGLFRAQMATKSSTTLEALEGLRNEIDRLITAPFTVEELSLAKESILNAFVFTMDTREKMLNQRVLLEFYGFPSDYFTRYPGLIGAVTAEDVARVAKQYVHPDRLAVLVVGKESEFEKPLSTLGEVKIVDIAIPPLEAEAAPTATDPAGMQLVDKVAEFVGGKSTIAGVNALRRNATMTMKTPQGEMQAEIVSTTRYPDAMHVVMKMPMGEITRVMSPDAAFMITPMGTQDIPGSQRDAALSEMKTDLISVLKNIGNAGYTFSAGATEQAGDVQGRILEIGAGGSTVKWLVDPATGRVIRTISRAGAPMPGDVVTELGEWKTFEGLTLPTSNVIMRDGEKSGEVRITEVDVNPTIDAAIFVKP